MTSPRHGARPNKQALALWLLPLLLAACAPLARSGAMRDLNDQLEREIRALRIRNEQLQQATQDCADTAQGRSDALYTELLQVFSGSEVQLAREGAAILLTIPGGLLFSTGSEEIRAEAAMVLDLLSVALTLHPEVKILVIGHTDDRPITGTLKRSHGDNWGLSVARAIAVMNALVAYQVAPERFTVAGRGSAEPIADNATPEGRAINRRIVVRLSP